jgi:signal transduction histidine kinase
VVRASSSTARILVVDGDEEARGASARALDGVAVVVAVAGPAEALAAAAGEVFDLVLLDLAQALSDGEAGPLLGRLRALPTLAEASIILLAPSGGDARTLAALQAGATDFLSAPFSAHELALRVSSVLELAALRREKAGAAGDVAGLRQSVRTRDEFLATAAHELRTPITTLGLQTDGLLSLASRAALGADERLPRRLTSIRHQVTRLDQMVNQLLDVSRMMDGRLELRPELVDLHEVAADAIELLREPAQRAGSPVTLRALPGVVGHWDRFRVGQVITNLVGNAIKFGGGRPIEVELAADPDHARLAVHDEGMGIALDEQLRIFERFERAASSAGQPGTGLGLWISKQIVDACRGTISIDSALGRGCTFTVQLPRGTPARQDASALAEPLAGAGPPHPAAGLPE